MLPLIMVLTWGFLPTLDEIRELYFRAFETKSGRSCKYGI